MFISKGVIPILLLSSVLSVSSLLDTEFRFRDGIWMRPILLNDVTGERFIQEGDWLFKVLMDVVRTGKESKKYLMDGTVLRYGTDMINDVIYDKCMSCMVLRSIEAESMRDWILDGSKIFFDKNLYNTMKLTGFMNSMITDGTSMVYTRNPMLNLLDLLIMLKKYDMRYMNTIGISVLRDVFLDTQKMYFAKDMMSFMGDVSLTDDVLHGMTTFYDKHLPNYMGGYMMDDVLHNRMYYTRAILKYMEWYIMTDYITDVEIENLKKRILYGKMYFGDKLVEDIYMDIFKHKLLERYMYTTTPMTSKMMVGREKMMPKMMDMNMMMHRGIYDKSMHDMVPSMHKYPTYGSYRPYYHTMPMMYDNMMMDKHMVGKRYWG